MTRFYTILASLFLGLTHLGHAQGCAGSRSHQVDRDKLNHTTTKVSSHVRMPRANRAQAFQQPGGNQLVGNPYIDESYYAGTVTFYNAKAKSNRFDKIRFNAFTHTLEITAGGKFSYLQGKIIQQFTLEQAGNRRVFINTQGYIGTPKPAFIEVLEDGSGPLQLARGVIVKVEKPAYGAEVNARPKPSKLARSVRFYLIKDKQLQVIKRKKDVYKFFAKMEWNAKSFVKKHRTKLKAKDLKHLVKHYNSLKTSVSPKVIAKTGQK